MEYNPLTSQVRSRREDLQELSKRATELRLQLGWYDAFDPAVSASLVMVEEPLVANLTTKLAELEEALAKATERGEGIRSAARPGWKPHYWFSETRSMAKSALAHYLAGIEKSEAVNHRYADERARALSSLTSARESLERYSKFDRDAAEVKLTGLEAEMRCSGAELDKWEAREKALDKELAVPMSELLAHRRRVEGLKSDLQNANRLERQLGQANTGYERAQIHEECQRNFGNGSPRNIVQKTGRAIDGAERNREKLERRLRDIGRRGALDVRKLVIDGSNLCYEADKFIGLFALQALCAQLAKDYEVIVVFDASIREKLGVPNNDALRSHLPGVDVYVDESEAGADETILDAAQGPTTFVVSDDRFADFSEKPAVARLIRYVIIDGRVLVRDLSIDVEFTNRR